MKIARITAMLSDLEHTGNRIAFTEKLCRDAIKEFPEDQDLRTAEDCLDSVGVHIASAEKYLREFLGKLEEKKLRDTRKL